MANARYTNLPGASFTTTDVEQSSDAKTHSFFDSFFDQPVQVSGVEWDIAYSFFLKYSGNEEAATSLSESTIMAAEEQGESIVDIITELNKYDNLELDTVLAIYFNNTRRPTSLLGVSQPRLSAKYVARNVLA